MEKERIIAHLDMDAFFASLEERDRPHLKGRPIVVGSNPDEGRGVVSTANYKAREYGIRSAMPITQAWRLSQEAKKRGGAEVVFLPTNFSTYQKSSGAVLEIIKTHSSLVEQGSIDEFYFDLSFSGNLAGARAICKKIKKEILEKEKVTCSIGLGPNKLIAKMAAGLDKPDGLSIVRQKDAEAFLEPMPVQNLPGIGPKTAEFFRHKNISTIKELKQFSREQLREMMGKWGTALYDRIRAVDHSPIETDREVKSIGEQNTFSQDSFDLLFIGEEFKKYCAHVFKRFKESHFTSFKTISVTVRFADFTTISSAKSPKKPLTKRDAKTFEIEAFKLLLPYLDKRKNPHLKKLRLVGVRIEKFEKGGLQDNLL